MSSCKYCGKEIYWGKVDGKPRPFNDEERSEQHNCRDNEPPKSNAPPATQKTIQENTAPQLKYSIAVGKLWSQNYNSIRVEIMQEFSSDTPKDAAHLIVSQSVDKFLALEKKKLEQENPNAQVTKK